jgi:hypothetical protein
VIELVEIQAIQVYTGQVGVVAQVRQGVFLGRDTLPAETIIVPAY